VAAMGSRAAGTGSAAAAPVRIRVLAEDIDVGELERWLQREDGGVGAIVSFTGYVRGRGAGGDIQRLWLEHYPGMTERAIGAIVAEATRRWALHAVAVLHRVGELGPGARIVYVGVASAHRGDAFAACEFIMDYLKTRAPFWKKECSGREERWVEPRDSDEAALRRWGAPGGGSGRPDAAEGSA